MMNFSNLINVIMEKASKKPRNIIAIAGAPTSGKSTCSGIVNLAT